MAKRRKNRVTRSSERSATYQRLATLALGGVTKPRPIDSTKDDFSRPIQWRWYLPSFDLAGIVSILALFNTVVGTVTLILSANIEKARGTLLSVGLVAYFLAGLLSWFRIVLARNRSYRKVVNVIYAKSNQLGRAWRRCPGPLYMAKDPIFQATPLLGPTLTVPRDGTVEENGNDDEPEAEAADVAEDAIPLATPEDEDNDSENV